MCYLTFVILSVIEMTLNLHSNTWIIIKTTTAVGYTRIE